MLETSLIRELFFSDPGTPCLLSIPRMKAIYHPLVMLKSEIHETGFYMMNQCTTHPVLEVGTDKNSMFVN